MVSAVCGRLIDDDALHRIDWEHMRCAGPEKLSKTLRTAQMDDERGLLFAAHKKMGVLIQTSDRCSCGARRAVGGGQLRECGGRRQPLGHGRRPTTTRNRRPLSRSSTLSNHRHFKSVGRALPAGRVASTAAPAEPAETTAIQKRTSRFVAYASIMEEKPPAWNKKVFVSTLLMSVSYFDCSQTLQNLSNRHHL